MFFLVLNSIRAVPSYSPSSDSVGRMCRSTCRRGSPYRPPGSGRTSCVGEQLLVDFQAGDEAYFGVEVGRLEFQAILRGGGGGGRNSLHPPTRFARSGRAGSRRAAPRLSPGVVPGNGEGRPAAEHGRRARDSSRPQKSRRSSHRAILDEADHHGREREEEAERPHDVRERAPTPGREPPPAGGSPRFWRT